MSVHQQPELKAAILALPDRAKDKLLIRLINKDKMLIKRLHFELLEDETDLQARVEHLRRQLQTLFVDAAKSMASNTSLNSIIAVNKLVRHANGIINEHEKVTKDKISEVEFRLLILKELIQRFSQIVEVSHLQASHKLHQYLAARIKFAYGKWLKLHEDYQFDFRDELQLIITWGSNSALSPYLRQYNIPMEI
ncbi:hypothetical protein [Sphingobacterium corticibacter]|uniref:Uncharacterized protein n=1 Tax=Sphingobacterium corticibacter TaxID=2171749 RepID=A0A2T8HJM5_9SPHI|nr:hypothetical protein [Sphingobacterium corticibacter]PVH25641.1 hypothetical protein DC487_06770 [Sphingobacterium corticibacter]